MGDVERIDGNRIARVGIDDNKPILNRVEIADRLDEVSLAVHQNQTSAGLGDILNDHRVQQRRLPAPWRRDNPVTGEPGLVAERQRKLRIEKAVKRCSTQVGIDNLTRCAPILPRADIVAGST